jgi:hypothetical protein
VSRVWVALAVLAAEAVMLACVVGLHVWDLLGGAGLTQWVSVKPAWSPGV